MTIELGLLLLLCTIIIIIIVLFVLFWVILKRQDNSISEINKIIEEIIIQNNKNSYNKNNSDKLLNKLIHEMSNEINKLKLDIEECRTNIIDKIDHLTDLYKKQTLVGLQDILVTEINRQFSTLQLDLAFKESSSKLKEPISRISQTLGVKSELPLAESPLRESKNNFISEFNRMLVESNYEQHFRERYKPTPALCNRNGMISLMITADEENLWIIPGSDNDNAFVLPSRRLLTKFLSTLLSNKGEGASTLIGSCFDVVVCDNLERAHLRCFAEAEIERNATGQIIKVRILKKGQLELPSGKG